jgi:hypothetical protein
VPLMDWVLNKQVVLRLQKSILVHWLNPPRDRDVTFLLGGGHVLLFDTTL